MINEVKEYYGKTLQNSQDLKTDACTTPGRLPEFIREALASVHEEVSSRYYGCGLICPRLLEGARILDLGSGSGRDCYVLSRLVGEHGYVVGIEMTNEQLDVARRHIGYHTEKYGYSKPNVEFRHGYIEELDALEADSFDVIVSNCVINLSPDKDSVLAQAHRLLKEGGELYFADVYSDRRIPKQLVDDPLLYGECLSGALYWNDFQEMAKSAGFLDPRLIEDRPITISNQSIFDRIGHVGFHSATYRLFKLGDLEPACEDYGQAVVYKGTIPRSEEVYVLDKHHVIAKGKVFPVCGNTFRMLHDTRLAGHFEFIGDWDNHYGIFEGCGSAIPFDRQAAPGDGTSAGSSCC